jgi:hypothetical protein
MDVRIDGVQYVPVTMKPADSDAPDRASVYYMHDNHLFTPLDLTGGVSYLLEQARQLAMESPGGMLCPVTLLRGKQEIRRVGVGVPAGWRGEGLKDTTAWEAAVRADVDAMRLLGPRSHNATHNH